jgi:hypothetical protein
MIYKTQIKEYNFYDMATSELLNENVEKKLCGMYIPVYIDSTLCPSWSDVTMNTGSECYCDRRNHLQGRVTWYEYH